MENNFLLTDEILWDYADGFLDAAEQLQVEAYIKQHAGQQARLDAILQEKRQFAAMPLEKPRVGFADAVMAAWVAEQAAVRVAAPAKPMDRVIAIIGGAMTVLMLVFFIIVYVSAPAIEPVSIPTEYIPSAPVIDWAMLFGNPFLLNGMLFLLALLGLKTLDKYLQHRSHTAGLRPGL